MSDSRGKFSVDLGLPVLPELEDPKLFLELLRIYNAIKITMSAVDAYSAVEPTDVLYRADTTPDQALAGVTRSHRFYLQAGEDLTAGQVVFIGADELAYAVKPITPDDGRPYVAFVGEDTLTGVWGIFYTKGVITLSSATLEAGKVYWCTDSGNLCADTHAQKYQPVGVALTSSHLLFDPDPYYRIVYVEPTP